MTRLQQKPIVHGRDHLPGHPDPIPGLLLGPSGTISDAIIATGAGAYYKLPETGTDDWADSSGFGLDAVYTSRTGEVRGVDSGLDEDDGSLCVTVEGPTPGAAVSSSYVGRATDNFFCMPAAAEFSLTARVRPSSLPVGSFSFGICGNVSESSPSLNRVGYGLFIAGAASGTSGHPLVVRATASDGQYVEGPNILTAGVWVRLTATFDGNTLTLYADDTFLDDNTDASPASMPATGGTTRFFQIGSVGIAEGVGGTQAPWHGEIDSVAVWDRCLDPSEVGGIADFDTAGGGTPAGYVPTSDGAGGSSWAKPTVEVEF